MASPFPVFFIRGLSTNGSDDAYFSIFNFGPMSRAFTREMIARGIDFIPIDGMGAGTVLELSKRAREILERHPLWLDPNQPVHLFGHSAGGLTARLVAAQDGIPAGKIKSVVTVATPNSGSAFATHLLNVPKEFPKSTRFLRTCGYDLSVRTEFLRDLIPENVAEMMRVHGHMPGDIARASVICWAPRNEWCLPLRLFYTIPCFNAFTLPSDGIVERDSQAFGEVLGEIHIDHFRQVGIFGGAERFAELCDTLADFFNRA